MLFPGQVVPANSVKVKYRAQGTWAACVVAFGRRGKAPNICQPISCARFVNASACQVDGDIFGFGEINFEAFAVSHSKRPRSRLHNVHLIQSNAISTWRIVVCTFRIPLCRTIVYVGEKELIVPYRAKLPGMKACSESLIGSGRAMSPRGAGCSVLPIQPRSWGIRRSCKGHPPRVLFCS